MRSATWLSLGFLVFTAACATSVRTDPTAAGGGPGGENGGPNGEGTTIPGSESDDSTPHAVGTITLGESRASGTGDSNPVISATFLPDAKLKKQCTKKVGACEMTQIPKCTTGTTATGCASGETCTFDDNCAAKCVKACTKVCGAGEECTFSSTAPPADQGMACRKRDRFDAGAIAFAGTTQAITLFPPYAVTPDGNGAPFLAKSEIRVQAAGAASAGFEKFDEKFTSTTFLETEPPLRDISKATVFGSGPIPISWVPGEDAVYVSVTGPLGTAKCGADDKKGAFDLPRNVVQEVMGSTGTSSSLTLAVTRERRETRKDKKTIGTLGGGQKVQPVGWIELVTTSGESFSYAACGTGQTMCGELCTNTTSDIKNCGSCGNVCPTSYYCSAGLCRY
jgi:hypothetical protein